MANGLPEPGIEKRWTLFDKVPVIVDEKFEDGREYALNAYRSAQEAIQRLGNLAEQLRAIDVNIPMPDDLTPPSLDDFGGTPPGAPPDITLNLPPDLDEADEVNEAIRAKLLHDITEGSPAVPKAIEDAIFQRDNERSLLVLQDELDKISAEWSKRRFTLPDGILAALTAQAIIEHGNKRQDVSRDIAIKSFELSDANTKFAIEKGIAWYGMRIQTYQAKVQAEIARIEAIVKAYLGEAQVYQAEAEVYSALTDAKVKKFDAEIKMALASAELVIKDAELHMKNYEILNNLKIEAMKAIASVSAQLVAGALSSVSASAHISAANAANYSYSPPPETSINE